MKPGTPVRFKERLEAGDNLYRMTIIEHKGDRCLIETHIPNLSINPTRNVKTQELEMEPETKVIFRKFEDGGNIIALFPELPCTKDYSICMAYNQRKKEHCGWQATFLTSITTPASPEEYKSLYNELTNIGYNLKVMKRMSQTMINNRIEAMKCSV